MNVLEDSPIEALAFNYLSFDFFNNLWTWLAVIFWRIRTPKPELLPPSTHDDTVPETLEPSNDDDDDNGLARVHCSTVVCNSAVKDDDGVTKGKTKFTSYYYEDDVIDRKCNEILTLTAELWEEPEGEEILGWWETWEKLLKTRTGENENGWYTCQDLTALNGDVVRFWDDGFGFATLPNEGKK